MTYENTAVHFMERQKLNKCVRANKIMKPERVFSESKCKRRGARIFLVTEEGMGEQAVRTREEKKGSWESTATSLLGVKF